MDGLRPENLKDLTGPKTGVAGATLRRALQRLVNTMIRVETPLFIIRSVFGGSLCALGKDASDVKSIAVGSTYRRLATKVAIKPRSKGLGQDLGPVQLGYGTQGGCEAAVHAVCEYLSVLTPNYVIVKLDVKNAFNSLDRRHILEIIKNRAPRLYPILRSAYLSPTPLFYGEHLISSESGFQQGDPAGPAIFSLAVDEIARDVTAPLNIWYLHHMYIASLSVDLSISYVKILKELLHG